MSQILPTRTERRLHLSQILTSFQILCRNFSSVQQYPSTHTFFPETNAPLGNLLKISAVLLQRFYFRLKYTLSRL
jgi:hypothetical protein